MFQREDFHRTLTGDEYKDNRGFRKRIESINAAHAVVAPYAHNLRVILNHEDDLRAFAGLCHVAELQKPFNATVEAEAKQFFSSKEIYRVETWLKTIPWPIAFQVEAAIRNGLLTTPELWSLRPAIEELMRNHSENAADILRLLVEALRKRTKAQSPLDCMADARRTPLVDKRPNAGTFLCHHVTVTPTRLLLEGPYVIQSNRVIRKYGPDYQSNFIRVDFRDEDHLQYRWERDVSAFAVWFFVSDADAS